MRTAGLARTLFMERRAAYSPTLDLQPGARWRPSAAQLAWLAGASAEFCVALRGGRAYGLRLAPAALPTPRPTGGLGGDACAVVAGGTKVRLRSEQGNQSHDNGFSCRRRVSSARDFFCAYMWHDDDDEGHHHLSV